VYSIEAADEGVELLAEIPFLIIQAQELQTLVAMLVYPVQDLMKAASTGLRGEYRVCFCEEKLLGSGRPSILIELQMMQQPQAHLNSICSEVHTHREFV